jgi:uncharacterized cupin superfamily protein
VTHVKGCYHSPAGWITPVTHPDDVKEVSREIEATFRGAKSAVRAGETINIPANAPHQFRNSSAKLVRLLCICSPAGQENFFAEVGVAVATRTTAPPMLDETAQAEFRAKSETLAPKYRTEILQHA